MDAQQRARGAARAADRIAKFTEDLIAAPGTARGPWIPIRRVGIMAALAMAAGKKPSLSIAPRHHIERYWPDVRLRIWFALEGGHIWASHGHYSIPLHRFALLKARSYWRRWFPNLPEARVVRR